MLTDNAYKLGGTWEQTSNSQSYIVKDSGNWYDVTMRFENSSYSRRFMGRLETGVESITDPAMANMQLDSEIHPDTPEHLRN